MLLFVSGDDLKQDLRQIMLLFVRAGRWDGPMGIIHQAEGLAALNDGRRVIEYLLDGISGHREDK